MSESDSFITEVTEEVRRDKLFKTFKKYSWVLGLIVAAIVGGTAYNEWNKNSLTKQAQLTGDVMRAALDAGNADAFVGLAQDGLSSAVIARFQLATVLTEAGDIQGAVVALRQITNQDGLSAIYTDLAWLKILMLSAADLDPSERDSVIATLTLETAPYRLLAVEQRALQSIRDGDIDAALDDLGRILADETVLQGLRNRAQQLTISLGGEIATSTNG